MDYNSSVSSLNLPSAVQGYTRYGVVIILNIVWDTSVYKPNVAGVYTITGTLTPPSGYTITVGIIVRIIVIVNVPSVENEKILSYDAVNLGELPVHTKFSDLPLPNVVGANTQSGKKVYLPVVWNSSSYLPGKAGVYTISGEVSVPGGYTFNTGVSKNVTAKVTLSERMIGAVDIMFIVDWTGSMNDKVTNVKNQLTAFANRINSEGLNVRWGLVVYTDIGYTTVHSTGSDYWFTDVEVFKARISGLGSTSGSQEVYIDALEAARRTLTTRENAKTFYILVTDEEGSTSNNYGVTGQQDMINRLVAAGINTSVITLTELYNGYAPITNATGGLMLNINGSFANYLEPLVAMMRQNT